MLMDKKGIPSSTILGLIGTYFFIVYFVSRTNRLHYITYIILLMIETGKIALTIHTTQIC